MRHLLLLTTLLAACSGEITGMDDGADGGGEDPSGPVTLTITSPTAGSTHDRTVVAGDGLLVARVKFSATATGDVARVAYLDESDTVLGEGLPPDFVADIDFSADGLRQVLAVAYDEDGAEQAEAGVELMVQSPIAADCHDFLDLNGVQFELGPANEGVIDPVTVRTPIAGIRYRYIANDDQRSEFFMDCELARSLVRAAPLLHARDVVEVVDYGVYNYRCIGGGEPPCPNGISQHAYAKAIDIAGMITSDGTYYSVNDDWVIDPDSEETCAAPTEGPKDAWLHDAICALKAAEVWHIVLTPNYNSDHRNHFHVDLTTNADFIERRFGPPVVDEGPNDW